MKNFDGKQPEELYAIISARQIVAVMFHSDLFEMFNFLALDKFACEQKQQCKEEFMGHLKFVEHYNKYYNKLMNDNNQAYARVDILPSEWSKYTRSDVTPQVRKKAITEAFTKWLDWEKETCEILSGIAYEFLKQQNVVDYEFIKCYIKDVKKEIQEITNIILELKITDYDEMHILEMQK